VYVRRRTAQVFYALLRPEFLKAYSKEKKMWLSSDAFTAFGHHDSVVRLFIVCWMIQCSLLVVFLVLEPALMRCVKVHNKEVADACTYMRKTVIETLAWDLKNHLVPVNTGQELCEEVSDCSGFLD
jgi:hypothetical protein